MQKKTSTRIFPHRDTDEQQLAHQKKSTCAVLPACTVVVNSMEDQIAIVMTHRGGNIVHCEDGLAVGSQEVSLC